MPGVALAEFGLEDECFKTRDNRSGLEPFYNLYAATAALPRLHRRRHEAIIGANENNISSFDLLNCFLRQNET